MIKYLENDFDKEISNKKVLVDFYADWCGPCKMLGSVLESINGIDILKVNVDKFPELAQKYLVMSIPRILVMDNGNIIKDHTGFMNKEELEEFINN